MKTHVHRQSDTRMFTAALSVIGPNWKASRCPSPGKWLKHLCYIRSMELYSAMERNMSLTRPHNWISRHIKQSENKPVTAEGYVLHDIMFSQWRHFRNKEEISGCQGLGGWRWRGVEDCDKWATRGTLGWWERPVSWPWWQIHEHTPRAGTSTDGKVWVTCMKCIKRSTVVSLVVVWCYSFAKCYHWANLDTMYITSVCVTSYNNADESTIISITTAIKNKGGKKVNKNFF